MTVRLFFSFVLLHWHKTWHFFIWFFLSLPGNLRLRIRSTMCHFQMHPFGTQAFGVLPLTPWKSYQGFPIFILTLTNRRFCFLLKECLAQGQPRTLYPFPPSPVAILGAQCNPSVKWHIDSSCRPSCWASLALLCYVVICSCFTAFETGKETCSRQPPPLQPVLQHLSPHVSK